MVPLNKPFHCILFVSISVFIFSGCKKEINPSEQQEEITSKANKIGRTKKINVSNLEQLYSAVNDAANAGKQIVLAPGTYILTPGYPNAGRIELQHNMELKGQPGHPGKVIIDASLLPAASFQLPPRPEFPAAGRTGIIRMGNGSNVVEWLTVWGNPNTGAVSAIETDLITTRTTHIRVSHCIVMGGQIGINIRNRDPASNGRIIIAEIEHNELADNLVGFGQGIGIQNARDVKGASIRATLRGNYIHGNRMGIRAFNVVANQCKISIQSYNDRFEENGLGLALLGAFNEYPDFTANDNFLGFEAYGTTVMNNRGVPSPPSGTAQVVPGGLLAIGCQVSVNSLPGTASNNRLYIDLRDCRFKDNLVPYDINAFGARSTYPSADPAGTDNAVNIQLQGISKKATVSATKSFPVEPAGTNTVNIFRR